MGVTRIAHPIETESYRRLRELVDLSGLPPLSRAVTERVIHASADLDYAEDLVLAEPALEAGAAALAAGRPIVVDAQMVAAGITGAETLCALGDPAVSEGAANGLTRSAAAMRLAARAVGPGALYVIGCAPTALFELLDLCAGVVGGIDPQPSLIIGLPVGFVGAAESKHALRETGIAAVSNRSRKGGSAAAAAALNALLYAEEAGR
ncbi:MAG TPA: precorrin-8X methylmutase [Egibacteraceae bacterium]|nr:precorrin-8X methylmutase [Egibacteraceae bacterium]